MFPFSLKLACSTELSTAVITNPTRQTGSSDREKENKHLIPRSERHSWIANPSLCSSQSDYRHEENTQEITKSSFVIPDLGRYRCCPQVWKCIGFPNLVLGKNQRQGAKAMSNQPPGRELFLQPRPLAHRGRWLSFIFLTQEKPLRIRHASQQVCTE